MSSILTNSWEGRSADDDTPLSTNSSPHSPIMNMKNFLKHNGPIEYACPDITNTIYMTYDDLSNRNWKKINTKFEAVALQQRCVFSC